MAGPKVADDVLVISDPPDLLTDSDPVMPALAGPTHISPARLVFRTGTTRLTGPDADLLSGSKHDEYGDLRVPGGCLFLFVASSLGKPLAGALSLQGVDVTGGSPPPDRVGVTTELERAGPDSRAVVERSRSRRAIRSSDRRSVSPKS